MTKQEIIYRACELVETKNTYGCVALMFAEHYTCVYPITYRFDRFYDRAGCYIWQNEDRESLTKEQCILMLLLFLEAEGDVL